MNCIFCDNEIIGEYFDCEERGKVCKRCKENIPGCERCGFPAQGTAETLGGTQQVPLCDKCFEEADNCVVCKCKIPGKWFSHKERGLVCEFCEENCDKCYFCSFPVAENTYRYPDGRISCSYCLDKAVRDQAELCSMEQHARIYMANHFGMVLRPPEEWPFTGEECPILLVSAKEMAKYRGEQFIKDSDKRLMGYFSAKGVPMDERGRVISEKYDLCIFIEDGYPWIETFSTIVHELTHLWQFDLFPGGVPETLVEGSACWVQWHALKNCNEHERADRLVENPDPKYGGGLRKILKFEKKHGFSETLKEIIQAAKEKRELR